MCAKLIAHPHNNARRLGGGLDDLSTFYEALTDTTELHGPSPYSRWDADRLYSPTGGQGRVFTRIATYVHSTYAFDADAFGLSPGEASLMDPQQRVLLEETVNAFASAGHSMPSVMGTATGVYVGCIWLEYGDVLAAAGLPSTAYTVTGNGLAFMSGRVSYTFGLIGPCIPTNTACSSSLVAYHLAARGIADGDCSMATASGVNALLDPAAASAAMTAVHALSPDGRCKSFGAEADGYGRGEGYIATVLESLDASSNAGKEQRARAVVAGSAVNQDGRSSGLTAPHGPSQQALIMAAMRDAGTTTLGYASSHGTGTPLGDPIETGAMRKAVAQGSGGSAEGFTVGAVKSLTGHLEGTAGLAGLLLSHVQLSKQFAHGLRYRYIKTHILL
jgi:acyl transferase domain-containing protein